MARVRKNDAVCLIGLKLHILDHGSTFNLHTRVAAAAPVAGAPGGRRRRREQGGEAGERGGRRVSGEAGKRGSGEAGSGAKYQDHLESIKC